MPRHLEKKYLIKSFDAVRQFISEHNLSLIKRSTTTHCYGQQDSKNVTKLVEWDDKFEIHVLEESEGTFALTENLPMQSVAEGLNWLKNHGFRIVDSVKMTSETYEYKGGLIRLYLIDDWLQTVILDYPLGDHEQIAHDLQMSNSKLISQPYNTYLKSIGRLQSKELS